MKENWEAEIKSRQKEELRLLYVFEPKLPSVEP
jgi:hypothetical protein